MADKKYFTIALLDNDEGRWLVFRQAFAEHEKRYDFGTNSLSFKDCGELFKYLDQCERGQGAGSAVLPNLIVINLNAPETGGRQTIEKLLSHPVCSRIPVIVFVKQACRATNSKADVIECYRCGVSEFSQVPDDGEALRKIILIIVNHWVCAAGLPRGPRFDCMGYG